MEIGEGQIQHAEQSAFERKEEIGIAGNTAQSPVGVNEERFHFTQRCELTVRSVENREGIGRVESSTTLESTDSRQRRCSPSIGNHAKGKARI